jgi:tetratricopeptide (TPR) repeat protein
MSNVTESRSGVIQSLDTRTKLLGLVALILEATLLGSLALLPEQHRIIAVIVSAAVLVVMIIGMIAIEINSSKQSQGTSETGKKLPPELIGSILEFDRKSWDAAGHDAALYRTASSMKFAGRYSDAITFYRKALAVNPNHWKSRYNIGSCLLYLGKLKQAEQEFKQLIDQLKELDWKSDNSIQKLIRGAYMQLNSVCDAEKRFGDGGAYLLQSLEVIPDDALAYANLAIASKKAGSDAEAGKWYQVLMEHPENVEVLIQISDSDKNELDSLL